MPNDTIDRAIRRGTGEEEGVNYEEITTKVMVRAASRCWSSR